MAAPSFDARDVEQHKISGGIGYLFPFVPFLVCSDSQFGRYCGKQGIWFWLAMAAIRILFGIIGWVFGWVPVFGALLSFIGWLCLVAVFLLELYYTAMAMFKGVAKEAPIVGSIQLFK